MTPFKIVVSFVAVTLASVVVPAVKADTHELQNKIAALEEVLGGIRTKAAQDPEVLTASAAVQTATDKFNHAVQGCPGFKADMEAALAADNKLMQKKAACPGLIAAADAVKAAEAQLDQVRAACPSIRAAEEATQDDERFTGLPRAPVERTSTNAARQPLTEKQEAACAEKYKAAQAQWNEASRQLSQAKAACPEVDRLREVWKVAHLQLSQDQAACPELEPLRAAIRTAYATQQDALSTAMQRVDPRSQDLLAERKRLQNELVGQR